MTARKSPREKTVRMTIKISESTREALDEFIGAFDEYVSRSEFIDYVLEEVLESDELLDILFPELDEEDEEDEEEE